MTKKMINLFPKELFLFKETHPGRASIMSPLDSVENWVLHTMFQKHMIRVMLHIPLPDTLSFIVRILENIKAK